MEPFGVDEQQAKPTLPDSGDKEYNRPRFHSAHLGTEERQMFRQISALLWAVMMAFALTACGGAENDNPTDGVTPPVMNPDQTINPDGNPITDPAVCETKGQVLKDGACIDKPVITADCTNVMPANGCWEDMATEERMTVTSQVNNDQCETTMAGPAAWERVRPYVGDQLPLVDSDETGTSRLMLTNGQLAIEIIPTDTSLGGPWMMNYQRCGS